MIKKVLVVCFIVILMPYLFYIYLVVGNNQESASIEKAQIANSLEKSTQWLLKNGGLPYQTGAAQG